MQKRRTAQAKTKPEEIPKRTTANEWKGLPCRSFRRALRLRVQQRTRMRQPAQHRNDNRQIAGHLRSCHVVRRLPNGERVRDAAHCASAEARTQSAACEAAARACSCLPSGLLGCRKGVQSAFLVGLLATALLARAPRAQALHISSPSAKRRTRRQPCRPERHEACLLNKWQRTMQTTWYVVANPFYRILLYVCVVYTSIAESATRHVPFCD